LIIPQKRFQIPTGGGRITIASWLRAPLSLSNGSRYYSVYETSRDASRSYSEIIVSTISPQHWGDLWRIEIDTYDTAGTLALISTIFSAHRLIVLTSEGSVNSLSNVNAMTFLVSAIRYRTKADDDSAKRFSNPDARLRTLEFLLALNLMDRVALDSAGLPKIKVRRMITYLALASEIVHGIRQHGAGGAAGGILKRNAIDIPKPNLAKLRADFGESIFCTWHVDTKVRLARAHLFPAELAPAHLQIVFSQNSTESLNLVLGHVYAVGGNVLKYQLRRGPPKGRAGRARLDITFSPLDARVLSGRELEARARDQILSDSRLVEMGVHVSKQSSGSRRGSTE